MAGTQNNPGKIQDILAFLTVLSKSGIFFNHFSSLNKINSTGINSEYLSVQ
jgi:hypothetical protein